MSLKTLFCMVGALGILSAAPALAQVPLPPDLPLPQVGATPGSAPVPAPMPMPMPQGGTNAFPPIPSGGFDPSVVAPLIGQIGTAVPQLVPSMPNLGPGNTRQGDDDAQQLRQR